MELSNYCVAVQRTLNKTKNVEINMIMGLFGEAGEFIDQLKKHLFQGHEDPTLEDELGDTLWYLCNYANIVGTKLTEEKTEDYTYHRDTTLGEFLALQSDLSLLGRIETTAYHASTADYKEHVGYVLQRAYTRIKHLCALLKLDISEVRQKNIDKLMVRYPDGFDAERSVNR